MEQTSSRARTKGITNEHPPAPDQICYHCGETYTEVAKQTSTVSSWLDIGNQKSSESGNTTNGNRTASRSYEKKSKTEHEQIEKHYQHVPMCDWEALAWIKENEGGEEEGVDGRGLD